MIALDDTIRLAPKAGNENIITDVLVVKSIRLRLSNLDNASSNDFDEGRPYNSEIWIYGQACPALSSFVHTGNRRLTCIGIYHHSFAIE